MIHNPLTLPVAHDQVVISRDQWLKEAEAAEHSQAPLTAAAIVRNTLHLGVDEEDKKVLSSILFSALYTV